MAQSKINELEFPGVGEGNQLSSAPISDKRQAVPPSSLKISSLSIPSQSIRSDYLGML